MGVTARIISPDVQLRDIAGRLAETEKLLGSPRPILKAFGVVTLRHVDLIYRAGGIPKWPPLAASTVAAKRQGHSKSRGTQALSGLRNTYDVEIAGRSVATFSRSPIAPFHELGTRGPYPIVAKNAQALALPFLPGRDGPSGPPGRFSLAKLGRTRRRGGKLVTPGGQARVPYSRTAFYKRVMHPGLQARPGLPTAAQVAPDLRKAAAVLLANAIARRHA